MGIRQGKNISWLPIMAWRAHSPASQEDSMPKHALPSVGLTGEQLFWMGNSPDNCIFLKMEKSITVSAFKK